VLKSASNSYVVNFNNPIDQDALEFYLQKQLESVALSEDFEYGVFDCANNNVVSGKYISYSKGKVFSEPTTRILTSHDNLTNYFTVSFPHRSSHIVDSMRTIIVMSLLLFFAILFFVYAISIILRQKHQQELQKDFINNMTHEFKTPISTSLISSNVLMKHPLIMEDSRLSNYARIIHDQSQRLNNQVEKVLQLVKIEGGKMELELVKCDLNELVETAASAAELRALDLGGTVEVSLCSGDTLLMADRLHLVNILNNIMDNALKYRKPDKPPKIYVSTTSDSEELRLTIRDEGIGIDKESLKKVFDKFFRVHTGNIHNVKGYGLGLFYVKNIVNAHKWKIIMQSELDTGTTVTIIFPRKNK
jgi:two-component system, OmpR family, phosphate regulon sensor histidine kinase PhoR